MPPAATAPAAAASASVPPVATAKPAAANPATVAAMLVASARPWRTSVSLTPAPRGVSGLSASLRSFSGASLVRKLMSARSKPWLCSSETAASRASGSWNTAIASRIVSDGTMSFLASLWFLARKRPRRRNGGIPRRRNPRLARNVRPRPRCEGGSASEPV
jgi:hypothetical protein